MLVKSYHVFTDYKDMFVNTRKEAEQIYKKWRDVDGYNNIRLYQDVSNTKSNDDIEEIYIKGRGSFPW